MGPGGREADQARGTSHLWGHTALDWVQAAASLFDIVGAAEREIERERDEI